MTIYIKHKLPCGHDACKKGSKSVRTEGPVDMNSAKFRHGNILILIGLTFLSKIFIIIIVFTFNSMCPDPGSCYSRLSVSVLHRALHHLANTPLSGYWSYYCSILKLDIYFLYIFLCGHSPLTWSCPHLENRGD